MVICDKASTTVRGCDYASPAGGAGRDPAPCGSFTESGAHACRAGAAACRGVPPSRRAGDHSEMQEKTEWKRSHAVISSWWASRRRAASPWGRPVPARPAHGARGTSQVARQVAEQPVEEDEDDECGEATAAAQLPRSPTCQTPAQRSVHDLLPALPAAGRRAACDPCATDLPAPADCRQRSTQRSRSTHQGQGRPLEPVGYDRHGR
jgi:hypothetical protein